MEMGKEKIGEDKLKKVTMEHLKERHPRAFSST